MGKDTVNIHVNEVINPGLKNLNELNEEVEEVKGTISGIADAIDIANECKEAVEEMQEHIVVADEEDITMTEVKQLKLADKNYSAEDFSGLGRVYLRKNIIDASSALPFNGFLNISPIVQPEGLGVIPNAILWDIHGKRFLAQITGEVVKYYAFWSSDTGYVSNLSEGDVFYNMGDNTYYEYADESLSETTEPTVKNVLTQDMVSKANTIYIIQYDYDLDDKTITIPENCVLQFEGGSLSNGTIELDNTYFSGFYSGFIHNVTINGTIKDVLSSLATVAKTGSYSDLNNKPIIPAQQIQSDWEQDDTDALDFIKHKPSVPAKVSDLENDEGYISSFTEEDPTVPSHVKSIKLTDINNWNNKLDSAPVTSVNGETGNVVLAIPEVRRLSPQITMTDTDNGVLTSLNISDIKDLLQSGTRVILDFTVTEWAGTYAAELTLINTSNNNYSIVGTAIGTNNIMGRVIGSNTSSNVFTLTKIS